jgi:hypothetical protein
MRLDFNDKTSGKEQSFEVYFADGGIYTTAGWRGATDGVSGMINDE